MSALSDEELTGFPGNPNSWYRNTAQRLLVDRRNQEIVPELKQLVMEDPSAIARLHAAWTLEGLGALTPDVIIILLKDPVAEVKENAIILSELWLDHPEIRRALLTLTLLPIVHFAKV